MISIAYSDDDAEAGKLVLAALCRSFTAAGAQRIRDRSEIDAGRCLVVVNPVGELSALAGEIASEGGKVLLLGNLDRDAARIAGVETEELPSQIRQLDQCAPAPTYGVSESDGVIVYSNHRVASANPLKRRPLRRFDFTDEWNNLGFGQIGTGDAIWDLSQGATLGTATMVAEIEGGRQGLPYATLNEAQGGAVLWFNRPCGPIDSYEWASVEDFFANYRHEDLPCVPALREAPFGCGLAVTMRLDCDEDLASARTLFEYYRDRGLPFSLAVKTSLDLGPEDIRLMRDVKAAGGSILSHSVNHHPNWGGTPEIAKAEAADSRRMLEKLLPGESVTGVVSPFHHTPAFVVPLLEEAGYEGIIGGVVSAEPEHILARGGRLANSERGIVLHSQQCMLHGDCMLETGDPIAIYRRAVENATAASAIFGYLDHPFSERYSYGWLSEEQRLARHADFLDHLENVARPGGGARFLSEDSCISLLRRRSACSLGLREGVPHLEDPLGGPDRLAICWRDQVIAA